MLVGQAAASRLASNNLMNATKKKPEFECVAAVKIVAVQASAALLQHLSGFGVAFAIGDGKHLVDRASPLGNAVVGVISLFGKVRDAAFRTTPAMWNLSA